MKNGFFNIVLISLITFTAQTSPAFINKDSEKPLLEQLNQEYLQDQIVFQDIRCSRRHQSCSFKFELRSHLAMCEVDQLGSAYDLIQESENKITLTDTANSSLRDCVKKFQ